jgi:hypothetical protein
MIALTGEALARLAIAATAETARESAKTPT